tara:strand:+ start:36758 stop:37675 length:918 start_codon:yes stop_codon:yes gene_type:complete
MNLTKNQYQNVELIKRKLEIIFKKYNQNIFLNSDPLGIVHEYKNSKDQELVAFVSSTFAFGNITYIRKTLKAIFFELGKSPTNTLFNMGSNLDNTLFRDFKYRWINSSAIRTFMLILSSILKKYGSLENCFLENYKKDEETLRDSLIHFRNKLINEGKNRKIDEKGNQGLQYLLPDPSKSSPCKRFNLFLRWVIRPSDGIDLGLWRSIHTNQLTIPLDTHMAKICVQIGLTKRKITNYLTAEDITNSLKAIDPIDPTRFDFAISRLGILKHCPKKCIVEICCECPIKELCINWEESKIQSNLNKK